jgi:RNA polymerase sigma-70 factor (ECF subfamily)
MCKDSNMDDNQLLQSCLDGNVEDFKKVIDKYKGKALALAWNYMGNREDAEDACQDAFLKSYLNLNTFDFSKSFKDWFYTILCNRCKDQLRKRRRFQTFVTSKKGEVLERVNHGARESTSSLKIPEGILGKLRPKERISLYLWANDGYTSKEIADLLKCSPSTARVHLFKARKKLKSLLEGSHVKL